MPKQYVPAKLSERSMEAVAAIQGAWPHLSRTGAIETALDEWLKNHSGENRKDAKLGSIDNRLLAVEVGLGQLTAVVQALVVTMGERNHEIGRRDSENEYGVCGAQGSGSPGAS